MPTQRKDLLVTLNRSFRSSLQNANKEIVEILVYLGKVDSFAVCRMLGTIPVELLRTLQCEVLENSASSIHHTAVDLVP
jgi:hypothetical protein